MSRPRPREHYTEILPGTRSTYKLEAIVTRHSREILDLEILEKSGSESDSDNDASDLVLKIQMLEAAQKLDLGKSRIDQLKESIESHFLAQRAQCEEDGDLQTAVQIVGWYSVYLARENRGRDALDLLLALRTDYMQEALYPEADDADERESLVDRPLDITSMHDHLKKHSKRMLPYEIPAAFSQLAAEFSIRNHDQSAQLVLQHVDLSVFGLDYFERMIDHYSESLDRDGLEALLPRIEHFLDTAHQRNQAIKRDGQDTAFFVLSEEELRLYGLDRYAFIEQSQQAENALQELLVTVQRELVALAPDEYYIPALEYLESVEGIFARTDGKKKLLAVLVAQGNTPLLETTADWTPARGWERVIEITRNIQQDLNEYFDSDRAVEEIGESLEYRKQEHCALLIDVAGALSGERELTSVLAGLIGSSDASPDCIEEMIDEVSDSLLRLNLLCTLMRKLGSHTSFSSARVAQLFLECQDVLKTVSEDSRGDEQDRVYMALGESQAEGEPEFAKRFIDSISSLQQRIRSTKGYSLTQLRFGNLQRWEEYYSELQTLLNQQQPPDATRNDHIDTHQSLAHFLLEVATIAIEKMDWETLDAVISRPEFSLPYKAQLLSRLADKIRPQLATV